LEVFAMRLTIPATLLLAVSVAAFASQPASHASAQPELKWGPAPAVFPAGAQMAVLQGDPAGAGLFTVRLRMPDGYRIAPHTHPTDEHVTVIRGTFRVGMGTTFNGKGLMPLPAGGFVTAPANQPHFAVAQGETIVQVHAMGPFALTYVNPTDNPARAYR
jgi:quercetin dioxygenase-like cupin family protein